MRDSDAFQNRPVSMNPKNNLLEIEEYNGSFRHSIMQNTFSIKT